jgi:SAM-dependent methyltransferase
MNSSTGKEILARIRDGDYAHPGEEEAIALVMRRFPPDRARRILDVGCGRGGTAQYLQEWGWGKVVGFDIDAVSVAYAQATYPQVTFVACDIYESSARLAGQFDLICLFTTFYALSDQPAALRELRRLAASRSFLVIFDYLDLAVKGEALPRMEEEGVCWNPIKLKNIGQLCESAGWTIIEVCDISDRFCAWYADLLSRIEARQDQIVSLAGDDWYRFVHDFYGGMLDTIKQGHLGGIIVTARAD